MDDWHVGRLQKSTTPALTACAPGSPAAAQPSGIKPRSSCGSAPCCSSIGSAQCCAGVATTATAASACRASMASAKWSTPRSGSAARVPDTDPLPPRTLPGGTAGLEAAERLCSAAAACLRVGMVLLAGGASSCHRCPHTSGSVRHGRRLQAACSRCMTGSSAAHHQAAPADGRRLGGRRRRMIVLPLVRGDQQARVRRRALHVLAHGAVLVCAFVVAARVRVALHDLLTILSPPAPRRSLPPLQLPAPRAPCACEAFRGRGDHAGGARR